MEATTTISNKQNAVSDHCSDSTTGLDTKYLTFLLAGEEYGFDILKVREIIGILDITIVPQTPSFVRGVVNLRGKVIPVIDLRSKFNLPLMEYNDKTCIIVINVGVLMGVIVDTVQEVYSIHDNQIEDPPDLGASVDSSYFLGMGKVEGSVKILLDIDRIISSEQLVEIGADVDQ